MLQGISSVSGDPVTSSQVVTSQAAGADVTLAATTVDPFLAGSGGGEAHARQNSADSGLGE